MNAPLKKTFWIFEPNLLPTLLILADLAGYDFGDSDWDAIRYGLTDTSNERNRWFDYKFWSSQPIGLLLARDEENRDLLFIHVLADEALDPSLNVLIYVVQEFELQHRHFKNNRVHVS